MTTPRIDNVDAEIYGREPVGDDPPAPSREPHIRNLTGATQGTRSPDNAFIRPRKFASPAQKERP